MREANVLSVPRITLCGDQAVLLEAEGQLSLLTQERIWALCDVVTDWQGVLDAQPGMNSLLVLLEPTESDAAQYVERLSTSWNGIESKKRIGKLLEVAVVYGGEGGCDLESVARHHGIGQEKVVRLHSDQEYTIFAPGSSPGFGYLYGLDPRLFIPRRKAPVMREAGGIVSIAGEQAMLGVPKRLNGPAMNPTGWYVIGRANDLPIPFDAERTPVSLFALGDRIRFRIERIER